MIICAVPPIIAALAWFMLQTNVGIAVRAAADNADRALLYGIPIRQLSTIVWTVAGGIAGLTFILKAPFAGSTATILEPRDALASGARRGGRRADGVASGRVLRRCRISRS